MLALHLLQSALVLVNPRLVDQFFAEHDFASRLSKHDLRGLTPVICSTVALHERFDLDMDERLDYDEGSGQPTTPAPAPTASAGGAA